MHVSWNFLETSNLLKKTAVNWN